MLILFPEIVLSDSSSQQSEVTQHQIQDFSSLRSYPDQKLQDFRLINKSTISSTSATTTISESIKKFLSFEKEFSGAKENEIEDSDSFCSSKTSKNENSSKCFGRREEEDEMEEEEEEFELVEPMVFDLVGIPKSCHLKLYFWRKILQNFLLM